MVREPSDLRINHEEHDEPEGLSQHNMSYRHESPVHEGIPSPSAIRCRVSLG